MGILLGTLAGFYESQERYDEAYQALEKGHKTLVEVVGKNHDSIGGIYLQQARLLRLQGQYQKAETRYEEAIEICRARLGKDHPKTIEGISGLAKLHATVNQSADAIRLMDRAQRSLHQHTMGVLPVLSEPEQLAFLKRFHHELLQQGLSLVLDRNLSEENRLRVASWLVNGKALAQQALAERLLLARDNTSPEARKLLIELEDVSRELGRLTLGRRPRQARHVPQPQRARQAAQAEEVLPLQKFAGFGGDAVAAQVKVRIGEDHGAGRLVVEAQPVQNQVAAADRAANAVLLDGERGIVQGQCCPRYQPEIAVRANNPYFGLVDVLPQRLQD